MPSEHVCKNRVLAWDRVAIDTLEVWLPDELQQLVSDSMGSFLIVHSCKSDGFKAHLSKELWGGS